jgi:hypothetical protein
MKNQDPKHLEIVKKIGERIVERMKEVDAVFEVEGSPTMTVDMKDGNYRKKVMFAGWEFFMKSSYVGQRGNLIFVLQPVEKQEFEFLELNVTEADSCLPLMSGIISEALGYGSVENMTNLISMMHKLIHSEIESAAKNDEMERIKVASNNPNWGRF